MNRSSQNLPEPVLPEHQLICDAAPHITISAGLKSRVLTSCQHQIALARWKFRLKVALSLLTACCLLLLINRRDAALPVNNTQSIDIESPPDAENPELYPQTSRSRSLVDKDPRQPVSTPDEKKRQQSVPSREVEQIHLLIEELKQREKKLCGVLPLI